MLKFGCGCMIAPEQRSFSPLSSKMHAHHLGPSRSSRPSPDVVAHSLRRIGFCCRRGSVGRRGNALTAQSSDRSRSLAVVLFCHLPTHPPERRVRDNLSSRGARRRRMPRECQISCVRSIRGDLTSPQCSGWHSLREEDGELGVSSSPFNGRFPMDAEIPQRQIDNFIAASSDGKAPRVLMILRRPRWRLSMALVV